MRSLSRPRSARAHGASRLAAGASVLLAGALLAAPAPALAHDAAGDTATNTRALEVATSGTGERMELVANLQYDGTGKAQQGSDIEFTRIGGHDYALVGTLRKGLQIIDITRPATPKRVAVYDCAVSQGDVQVWHKDGRVLASYTADGTFGVVGAASRCAQDLQLGPQASGTVLVDITKPSRPVTVSFLPVPEGSHNMTIHPSGDYLYNSNSDLLTGGPDPKVTIFDVSVPSSPRKVQDFPLPFVPTSLGSEAHDITFSPDGDRAYVAAISQTLVLDTTDPERPRQLSQIVDPAVNVAHQSDPITVRRKDGTERTLLIVTDERAGAAASAECPGGGLHVYDVTGPLEQRPAKIGAWFIDAFRVQDGATCTSHVLRVYPEQQMMTIAWYAQGVRVLDLSGLAEATGGPATLAFGDGIGMREVGSYVLSDSDTWSFKTNRIETDGSFYGYGNDLVRGFDVYRFDGLTDRTVPALVPEDMRPPKSRPNATSGSWAPVALVAPSAVLAVWLRRRQKVCSEPGNVPVRTSSA